MNFLHIHTTDTTGGAAISGYRLHLALQQAGHKSRILCGWKSSADPSTAAMLPGRYGPALNQAVGGLFHRFGWEAAGFPSAYFMRRSSWIKDWADAIILKNLHGGYFDLSVLPWLSVQAPLIWRLPDMWPVTGNCVYSYDCTRWQTGCGACPQLDTYPVLPFDNTRALWRRKQKIYARLKGRLTFVSPSRWLQKIVQTSPLTRDFPCEHIPSGVDLQVFRPGLRDEARKVLGIGPDSRVIMFLACDLSDLRKGGPELLEVLQQIRSRTGKLVVLTVGQLKGGGTAPDGVTFLPTGFIQDERFLNMCYNAADVYLSLSRADNLPNTMIEAAAAGLPMVTLNNGGCAETLIPNQSGYVVEDVVGAAVALRRLFEDQGLREQFGRNSRVYAEKHFSMALQVDRYTRLAGRLSAPASAFSEA